MRLLEVLVFAVLALLGLRYMGVTTDIPELDRWISILIESIHRARQFILA